MGDVPRRSRTVNVSHVSQFPVLHGTLHGLFDGDLISFVDVVLASDTVNVGQLSIKMPLTSCCQLPVKDVRRLATLHRVILPRGSLSFAQCEAAFAAHDCQANPCSSYALLFSRLPRSVVNPFGRANYTPRIPPPLPHAPFQFPSTDFFPPPPATLAAKLEIIREWTAAMSGAALAEGPCAVCAELTLTSQMVRIPVNDTLFLILRRLDIAVAVCERPTPDTSVQIIRSPILERAGIVLCDSVPHCQVCGQCKKSLDEQRLPPRSLANGLWLGDVATPLVILNYCERIIIARFRHNAFVIAVQMGQRRMRANAITFSQPIAKVFAVLPPPREEMDECLAILFTGPCAPTPADLKRTPFLVSHRRVWNALVWLTVNHSDYHDIELSRSNLEQYTDDAAPVSIIYRPRPETEGASAPETLAVFDDGEDKGTDDGPCSFAVHALTSDTLDGLSRDARTAEAIRHLQSGGKVLSYGHAEGPESIYHNSKLFPGMFPWLFPYGKGGFENLAIKARLGRGQHIQHLLNYHDRRFQEDEFFAFVIHSHNQIRGTNVGGYMLTSQRNFSHVAEKILTIDTQTLDELIARGNREGFILPINEKEKRCFELLHFVDHVAGHVPNSTTQKRLQKNQIRSLTYHVGTPVFFITVSPADLKSPVCLRYAGEDIDLISSSPRMPDASARMRAVARNPVACARFFHLVVTLFIKHVLRWGTGTDGLYGPTAGYYGTVESQGRLTLHLHLLLWIKCSLTPQQVRDRALHNAEFQRELIEWLESCCTGELFAGPMEEVLAESHSVNVVSDVDPTMSLPDAPPSRDSSQQTIDTYVQDVKDTVDLLVMKNHVHKCGPHCLRNGECRARFPREVRLESSFDELGALQLKHKEPMINSFTPIVDYLVRCNTDTTCLLSGTQVKAVIAYITDYITKYQLETYTLFEVIRAVLDKHADIVHDSGDRGQAARRLMIKIVNALNAKLETGGPMLCASLLGHPDHYTSHSFKTFYWYPYLRYVAEVCNIHLPGTDDAHDDSVVLDLDSRAKVVGRSKVHDYIYRPQHCATMCLYDYVRICTLKKFRSGTTVVDGEADDVDPADRQYSEEPENTSTAGGYPLLRHHPSFSTHRVLVAQEYEHIVVDFLGTPLPRKDVGGDVYYAAMLMFFKPGGWRTGQELQDTSSSWRETFERTTFSPHSLKVMNHFSVFYECQDSRHDCSAQRKKNKSYVSPLAIFSNQELNTLDIQAEEDAALPSMDPGAFDDIVDAECRSANVLKEMELMKSLLTTLSANRKDPDASIPIAVVDANVDIPPLSAKQWTSLVNVKKSAVIAARNAAELPLVLTTSVSPSSHSFHPNTVCVISPLSCTHSVHAAYIDQADPAVFSNAAITPMMKEICAHYTLNAAQVRAFVTIAASVTTRDSDQLLMYLGGMGGTGKSQVIKALTAFFHARHERQRLLLLAPTGAAACLINGSTYHAVLKFGRNTGPLTPNAIDDVRANLRGVDVIFIDEVSMVSSSDLRRISSNIASARKNYSAFGGLHIVLAGDFCQLPPASPGATALYSRKPANGGNNTAQDAALGITIWRQFTTVVILRENMRQRGLLDGDRRLRAALVRLRVRACNDADIDLFRSRVTGINPAAPSITDPSFSSVSIITAWNSHRDAINEYMSVRFAKDRNVPLVTFYSRDEWGTRSRTARAYNDVGPHINTKLQHILWSVPSSMVKKPIPGMLKLCIGMPVMIKQNEATELCITNGAEATVYGWKTKSTKSNMPTLDVLFVRLKDPPLDVQIGDLPVNVVPLPARTETVLVDLPNKSSVSIKRCQVPVLPNFAMTDYCSQGRTRPFNAVDLRHCRSHQAVYTCLSRGSSLDGLLILHSFGDGKFIGGLSGDLRAETQELELLDDLFLLKFEGKLDPRVKGMTRDVLLKSFHVVYGSGYRPIHVRVNAKASLKRSLPSTGGDVPHKRPRSTLVIEDDAPGAAGFLQLYGLRWDALDHSCAYDSILTIFLNCELAFPTMWSTVKGSNFVVDFFLQQYFIAQHAPTNTSLSPSEIARDQLRDVLSSLDSEAFPRRGSATAAIGDLVKHLTDLRAAYGTRQTLCVDCDVGRHISAPITNVLWTAADALLDSSGDVSVSALFHTLLFATEESPCEGCGDVSVIPLSVYHSVPSLLLLELPTQYPGAVFIEPEFDMMLDGFPASWSLQGAIYHGGNHFTSRFIHSDRSVWYHDGADSGAHCRFEYADISSVPNLGFAYNRKLSVLVYRRKTE